MPGLSRQPTRSRPALPGLGCRGLTLPILVPLPRPPPLSHAVDSLSDGDFKRVDEVCGILAEKGTGLGGPWSDHLDGPVWDFASGYTRRRSG